MSKYTAPSFRVEKPAAEIADKFADLTSLQAFLDKVPEAEREKLGNIEFEPDSISLNTSQIGKVKFRVSERSASNVTMRSEGTPLPIFLNLDLKPDASAAATDVTCCIDVDLPMMLKPMVAPHLTKAVGMLSDLIKKAIE